MNKATKWHDGTLEWIIYILLREREIVRSNAEVMGPEMQLSATDQIASINDLIEMAQSRKWENDGDSTS